MENLTISEGISYTSEMMATAKNTARSLGSGKLEVLGTPAMIALMENAAMKAVEKCLLEEYDTVGGDVLVVHSKPSAIGEKITATATVTKIEGRKITFEVVASDSKGEIGRGIHNRFIVETEKFLAKLNQSE